MMFTYSDISPGRRGQRRISERERTRAISRLHKSAPEATLQPGLPALEVAEAHVFMMSHRGYSRFLPALEVAEVCREHSTRAPINFAESYSRMVADGGVMTVVKVRWDWIEKRISRGMKLVGITMSNRDRVV